MEKNEIDAHSLQKDHNKFIKKKSILKTQQRFKNSERNFFTEEINMISSNDGKRIQSIDSLETYAYGTSKDLVSKKRKKSNNTIKRNKND